MASRQAVAAPPVQPPQYSLMIAAPAADSPDRWQDGWSFSPEGCGASGRQAVVFCGDGAARTVAANPGQVDQDPILVWAGDSCTSRGFQARDYQGRARRQLEATQSYQLANELWTGTVRTAAGLGNVALSDASSDTVTDGTGVTPNLALGRLTGALADCGQGQRGMIHVTPQLLVSLGTNGTVRREGGLWLDPMGNIVVADAGYDGSGPGGVPASTTQWAYATSMMAVRTSPIEILPDSFESALNTDINQVTFFAQRLAGVVWSECCHLAAEVALPVPLVGPPS